MLTYSTQQQLTCKAEIEMVWLCKGHDSQVALFLQYIIGGLQKTLQVRWGKQLAIFKTQRISFSSIITITTTIIANIIIDIINL